MNLINKCFETVGNISFPERKYKDCNVVTLNENNVCYIWEMSVPDLFRNFF
jgi:hypothetical protein